MAIDRIATIDYPADLMQLLVVEGRNPSRQRNCAVQQARGQIVYFLDDDAMVSVDCLQRIASHFADPTVSAVGGPSLTPANDSVLQRSFGAALASPFGAGGVTSRYRRVGSVRAATERELILCNLAVRRDRFLECGGFDERLYPNEENEFLDRLSNLGGRILHDPDLAVRRSQRDTIGAFIKQMFRYGRGRARQTRIAGFSGVMPFVPLFFVLYLLSLLFISRVFWLLPLLLYGFLTLVISVAASWRERSAALGVLLPAIFPLLHCANGIGLLAGFLQPLPKQPCYKDEPVTVRRISLPLQDSGVAEWI